MKETRFLEKLFIVMVLGLMFVALAQTSTVIDPDYIDVPELRIDGTTFTEGDYDTYTYLTTIDIGLGDTVMYLRINNWGEVLFENSSDSDYYLYDKNGNSLVALGNGNEPEGLDSGLEAFTWSTSYRYYIVNNGGDSTQKYIYDRSSLVDTLDCDSDDGSVSAFADQPEFMSMSPNGKFVAIRGDSRYILIYEGS